MDVPATSVELLLTRARVHIAARRDLDAQADLRDIIRVDPGCGPAFRLLGELAARRDEHESAAIFFREALRLDPGDHESSERLAAVQQSIRPAQPHPAPAAAAGRVRFGTANPERYNTKPLASPAFPRARGTSPPHASEATEERDSTTRFARGSHLEQSPVWKTPAPQPDGIPAQLRASPGSAGARSDAEGRREGPLEQPTMPGEMIPPRKPLSAPPRPLSRGPTPELPGFGEYLVASGILTRERLRAAQAYQRSMKVQLSTAIVTLGLATPQRIEWAAVAHQSQLARDRQNQ